MFHIKKSYNHSVSKTIHAEITTTYLIFDFFFKNTNFSEEVRNVLWYNPTWLTGLKTPPHKVNLILRAIQDLLPLENDW